MHWNLTLITSKMNTIKLIVYMIPHIWKAARMFFIWSFDGCRRFDLELRTSIAFFVQNSISPVSRSVCNCLLKVSVKIDFLRNKNAGEYMKIRSLVNVKRRYGEFFKLNDFCDKSVDSATALDSLSYKYRRLVINSFCLNTILKKKSNNNNIQWKQWKVSI